MANYISAVKIFLVNMFTQNESVGLKGLEKIQVKHEVSVAKNDPDLKFLNILN